MTQANDTGARRLTIARIAAALGLGAVTGGVLTIVVFAASAFALPDVGPGLETSAAFSLGVLATWLLLLLFVTLVWGVGLILIGGPFWFFLHRLNLRARFHAMMVGALLAGVAGYVFGSFADAPYPAAWFLAFAFVGMVVAWQIWTLCYGGKSRVRASAE